MFVIKKFMSRNTTNLVMQQEGDVLVTSLLYTNIQVEIMTLCVYCVDVRHHEIYVKKYDRCHTARGGWRVSNLSLFALHNSKWKSCHHVINEWMLVIEKVMSRNTTSLVMHLEGDVLVTSPLNTNQSGNEVIMCSMSGCSSSRNLCQEIRQMSYCNRRVTC